MPHPEMCHHIVVFGSRLQASGDLRNIVQTVASTPPGFQQKLLITVNDRDFEVVARNLLLLLYLLTSVDDRGSAEDDIDAIAESLIQLWYSAFLPVAVLSDFIRRVQPLVQDVCTSIRGKAASGHALLGKTWRFKDTQIRAVLIKEQWSGLGDYFSFDVELTTEEARAIRSAVTLAPSRADFRDRWFFKDSTTFTRVAKQQFREDGLLLPFGDCRRNHTAPNP